MNDETEAKCKCGKIAEWADEFCQDCWEEYADRKWWEACIKMDCDLSGEECNAEHKGCLSLKK